MPLNLRHAAYSYIDEWLGWDKRFHANLRPENDTSEASLLGPKMLTEAAAYYGVSRTLPLKQEFCRLIGAYEELVAIKEVGEDEVTEVVEHYAESLKSHYGKFALSAASKFLWMRFRDPVVIYDSVTLNWLWNQGHHHAGYRGFREAWLKEYLDREDEAREACADLTRFKPFILRQITENELAACTSSSWFMRRVFDHAMINAI